MTRRMIVILAALLGLAAVVLAAAASPASAQTGLPFVFDFRALFESIFNSFPPFVQSFLGPLFGAILQGFTGSCAPFCAS